MPMKPAISGCWHSCYEFGCVCSAIPITSMIDSYPSRNARASVTNFQGGPFMSLTKVRLSKRLLTIWGHWRNSKQALFLNLYYLET